MSHLCKQKCINAFCQSDHTAHPYTHDMPDMWRGRAGAADIEEIRDRPTLMWGWCTRFPFLWMDGWSKTHFTSRPIDLSPQHTTLWNWMPSFRSGGAREIAKQFVERARARCRPRPRPVPSRLEASFKRVAVWQASRIAQATLRQSQTLPFGVGRTYRTLFSLAPLQVAQQFKGFTHRTSIFSKNKNKKNIQIKTKWHRDQVLHMKETLFMWKKILCKKWDFIVDVCFRHWDRMANKGKEDIGDRDPLFLCVQ